MSPGLLYDTQPPEGWPQSVEDWLRIGTQVLSRTAETAAAFIIAVGVLTALLAYMVSRVRGLHGAPDSMGRTESIRLQLGGALGLSLEFLLAADILSTAVAPSWEAIGKLAAIATIRTLLNYFLGLELRQEERRRLIAETPVREDR